MKLEINKSHELFRKFFHESPIGVCIISADKTYSKVNSKFCEVLGYSEEEIIGKNIGQFTYEKDLLSVKALAKKVFSSEIPSFQIEKRYIKKNNKVIWAKLHATIVKNSSGYPIFGIGIIEDINDRKLYQEKIKSRNLQLKKINMELDQFVYSLSHDIRSPLASILGLVNILEKDRENIDDISQYLSMIKSSVNRLNYLIKDITDYSKNSRTKIKTETINLKELIQYCYDDLMQVHSHSKAVLINDIDDSLRLLSDQSRVFVILKNLISNAIKFSRKDMSLPTIRVYTSVSKLGFNIHIKDNGQGICHTHIKNIFDIFYRANEDGTGSGLGLYIAQEVICTLKGHISVSSTLNEGSEFTVTIPQ